MSSIKPQAPKTITILVSIALVLIGHFGGSIAPEVARNGDFIALAGFILLLLGVYIKGL